MREEKKLVWKLRESLDGGDSEELMSKRKWWVWVGVYLVWMVRKVYMLYLKVFCWLDFFFYFIRIYCYYVRSFGN